MNVRLAVPALWVALAGCVDDPRLELLVLEQHDDCLVQCKGTDAVAPPLFDPQEWSLPVDACGASDEPVACSALPGESRYLVLASYRGFSFSKPEDAPAPGVDASTDGRDPAALTMSFWTADGHENATQGAHAHTGFRGDARAPGPETDWHDLTLRATTPELPTATLTLERDRTPPALAFYSWSRTNGCVLARCLPDGAVDSSALDGGLAGAEPTEDAWCSEPEPTCAFGAGSVDLLLHAAYPSRARTGSVPIAVPTTTVQRAGLPVGSDAFSVAWVGDTTSDGEAMARAFVELPGGEEPLVVDLTTGVRGSNLATSRLRIRPSSPNRR